MGNLVGVVLVALLPLCLAVLTGLGQRERGSRRLVAAVAGLLFPLTWAAWYLRDERPGCKQLLELTEPSSVHDVKTGRSPQLARCAESPAL